MTQAWLEDTRDFWAYFFRNFWRVRDVKRFLRESREPGIRCWAEMSAMLATLAAEADLLVTGVAYQELVANVAEYRAIPLSLQCSGFQYESTVTLFRTCPRR